MTKPSLSSALDSDNDKSGNLFVERRKGGSRRYLFELDMIVFFQLDQLMIVLVCFFMLKMWILATFSHIYVLTGPDGHDNLNIIDFSMVCILIHCK